MICLFGVLVFADDNLYCIGSHVLTCPIGNTQDDITLLNITTGGTQTLTTSQNSIGMWNASYSFNTTGKYCARCDVTNVSRCFDVVDYCQEGIKSAVDDIQEDIGDPSAEGFSIWGALKQFIKNAMGVYVG